MDIVMLAPDRIRPYEANPRKNDQVAEPAPRNDAPAKKKRTKKKEAVAS